MKKNGLSTFKKASPMLTAALALFILLAFSLPCSAAVVFTSDFELGTPPELSGAGSRVSVAGFPVAAGLGGYAWQNTSAGNPATPTTISLTGLAAHTWLRVSFDFIAFDSWDGLNQTWGPDYLNLVIGASAAQYSVIHSPASIEDHQVSGPFDNSSIGRTFSDGTSYGGNSGWPDSVWHIVFQIPHAAGTADLNFFASGSGWQGGSDESFGLDNIVVQTDTAAVPEPSAMILLGSGLIGLLWFRKR